MPYTSRVVCIVAVLSFVPTEFSVAQTVDPVRYVFPDAVTPSHDLKAIKPYDQVRDRMTELSRGKGTEASLTDSEYSRLMTALNQIIAKHPEDPIRPYVERRLVFLDWQAGKIDELGAAQRLNGLAGQMSSESEARFTKGCAITILARGGHFPRAAEGFGKLDPIRTSQYGWFVFETVKYYADYAAALTPKANTPESGHPQEDDYLRKRGFMLFVRDVLLPRMEQSVKAAEQKRSLERDQIVSCMNRIARDVHIVLGPRIYPDISQSASDEILPRLLSIWSSSLRLLDDSTVEQRDWHEKKIKVYSERIIPRLHTLQKDYEFKREFMPLIEPADSRIKDLSATISGLGTESESTRESVSAESVPHEKEDGPSRSPNETQIAGQEGVIDSRSQHSFLAYVYIGLATVCVVLAMWGLLRLRRRQTAP